MNYKAFWTIIGCVLIHISLGTLYTASNMITYIISYIHNVVGDTNVTSVMSAWLFAISIMGQACSMMIAGKIEDKLGSRMCTLIGCVGFILSVGLTYWAVENFYTMLIVYGYFFGFFVGIAYSAPISMAIKWMPDKRGLATGIIVAGFGCGALIFNQVQAKIINPNNVAPILAEDGGKYFPAEVVKNIPKLFLILAGIYFIMEAIGLLLLSEPSEEESAAMKEKTAHLAGDLKSKGTGFTPREMKTPVEPTPRGTHAITPSGQTVDHPYKPNEAMRTVKFWEIWSTFLMVGLTTTFMSSYWKTFGQSFIDDDSFLVLAGSVSSVCNGLFRPIWGTLMDKLTYRYAMGIDCLLCAVLVGTLSFTAYWHRIFFFIWICLIYLAMGGFYAMFPAYTSLSFGHLYMVSNYGWVFTNQFISSFVSAFFVNAFINTLGNTGLTLVLAVMLVGASCVAFFGKKWDYHIGRRELQKTLPSAQLPANVTLPPQVAAAASAGKVDVLPAVDEKEEVQPQPTEVAVSMPTEEKKDN